MLSCTGVSLVRGRRRVLGPLDLALGGKGVTVLMGPNGSGKTSLLNLLHGIESPSTGVVRWAAPRRQAFVFQRPVMLRRSVRENLALPLMLSRAPLKDVGAVAKELGLSPLLDTPARALSGGEAQRLALGRALIAAPEVLFLDEPTANLDLAHGARVEEMLAACAASGTRLIMATHALGQARRLATEVLWLEGGELIGPLPAAQFFEAPPEPARSYLEAQT